MKYEIRYTKKFKKDYERLIRRNLDVNLLDNVVYVIASGLQLDPKYRNHFLTGDYIGYSECHVKSDWLLIYIVDDKNKILTLVRTGSHSDLF